MLKLVMISVTKNVKRILFFVFVFKRVQKTGAFYIEGIRKNNSI